MESKTQFQNEVGKRLIETNFSKIRRDEAETTGAIEKEKRILFVGDIGGGTKYFSETAMRGLYRMLKESDRNNLPDSIIFTGILPEIPQYATKGGLDRLAAVEHGIDTCDDAVVSVKPSLSRIIDLLKEKEAKTDVYYILSPEDRSNIKNRDYDRLINAYNYAVDKLMDLKEGYIKMFETKDELVKDMSYVKEKKEKEMKKLFGKVDNKKIEQIDEKIKQSEDEMEDYKKIIQLYTKLQSAWVWDHPELTTIELAKFIGPNNKWNSGLYVLHTQRHGLENVKQERARIEQDYKKAIAKQRKIDEYKNPEEYKRVEEEVKNLANMKQKIGHETMDIEKNRAETSGAEIFRGGEIFTHNIRARHEVAEIAFELANLENLTHIKNAFGRRYPLNIINDSEGISTFYGDIEVGNSIIRVANNPSNTSMQFKNNIEKYVESILTREKSAKKSNIDLIIGGRGIVAEVKAVPIVDEGKGIYVVISPPLVDIEKLGTLWNEKIKNPFTMMYEKADGVISSGIWDIRMNGVSTKFTFHTFGELTLKSSEEFSEQRKVLEHKLRLFANKINKKTEILKNDDKDILQIMHKMPSEWNSSLVEHFLVYIGADPKDKKTVLKLADALTNGNLDKTQKSRREFENLKKFIDETLPVTGRNGATKTIHINGISDTHIGASGRGWWTPQDMLRAYLVRELNNDIKKDAIIFGGDIIDSNYGMHNFEMDTQKDWVRNLPLFKRFLEEQKGFSKDQVERAVDRYAKHLLQKQPVYNINNQGALLSYALEPLFKAEKTKDLKIVAIAGNHYNKKNQSKELDEATAITNIVDPYFDKMNIKPIYGGDYGIGYTKISGETFLMSHFMSDKLLKSLRTSDKVVGSFSGDIHEFDFKVMGDKFIATIPAGAYANVFPKQVGIPVSEDLRGYANYEVSMKNGKTASLTVEMVPQTLLEKEGYLVKDDIDKVIEEFEEKVLDRAEFGSIMSMLRRNTNN